MEGQHSQAVVEAVGPPPHRRALAERGMTQLQQRTASRALADLLIRNATFPAYNHAPNGWSPASSPFWYQGRTNKRMLHPMIQKL